MAVDPGLFSNGRRSNPHPMSVTKKIVTRQWLRESVGKLTFRVYLLKDEYLALKLIGKEMHLHLIVLRFLTLLFAMS